MSNTITGQEATPTTIDPTPAVEVQTEPTSAENIFSGSGSITEPDQNTGVDVGGAENGSEGSLGDGSVPENPLGAAASASMMTGEQIAQAAAQAAIAAQQSQQHAQQQANAQAKAAEPRQYTTEELNIYQLNEDHFNKIFDSEDKAVSIQALNDMLQGVAKQAYTMAQINNQQVMDQRFGEMDQRLQPHLTFAQQQQELAAEQQFYSDYPTLQGMNSVVDQVTAQLRQEGAQFPSHKELFSEVAKRTQAIITTISGQQPQGQVANQGQLPPQRTAAPTTQQKPAMAAVGAGGSGGAGGGQTATTGKPNAAQSIFG